MVSDKYTPILLKFIDRFEKNKCRYEAYRFINGKVMLIDEKGGIIFFGDDKEYFHYKEKILDLRK